MINLKKIVRQNIWDLDAYTSARDEFSGSEGVFLDANENPFGTLNRYPDPYQIELKSTLAELKKVDLQNIFVGNGSDEIIDLVFRIFCNPGKDRALTFSPTYGMYDVSANINNVDLIKVPLNNSFQINIEQTIPLLNDKQLKLIFICSPNNPTGNTINQSDIAYLLENFKGIVFIDEAYIDFANNDSWIEMINQYNNLIVSQTFSKARGLAAARIGVAYTNTAIIKLLNKVKPPYNVSKLNQEAATKALKNIEEYEHNIAIILNQKETLIKALKQSNKVIQVYPSDANFLLVEVTDANTIYNALVKQKIITRNRNNLVNNCIRITIGSESENNLFITTLNNL